MIILFAILVTMIILLLPVIVIIALIGTKPVNLDKEARTQAIIDISDNEISYLKYDNAFRNNDFDEPIYL